MLTIYIMLTLASIVFHILYKGDLSFVLMLFFLITPFVTFGIQIIQTLRLKIAVSLSCTSAERKTPAAVRITLNNRSFLPISACRITVRYKSVFAPEKDCSEKYSLAVPIGQRSAETVSLSFTPQHCGEIAVSLRHITICDFLGIIRLRKKINYNGKFTVLPRAPRISADIESSLAEDPESSAFSSVKAGDDPSEIFSLREYRDGDRRNRIHWKLSSRNESLIVKELSQPVSSKILILCDFFGCTDPDGADGIFDMAATLSSFLAESGAAHTVSAAYSDRTLFSADIRNAEEYCCAFAKLCASADKLEFRAAASETADALDGASPIQNSFSRVLAVSVCSGKAYADELSRLCGETRLTIFCTALAENAADEPSSAAEIIFADAEKLADGDIGNIIL